MTPYRLSERQAKEADRVGGIALMLPWPDGLPPGPPLRDGDTRDATAAEHAAAEQIVGEDCRRRGLVPVRSEVAMALPPDRLQHEQRLVAIIIGHRWVHATNAPAPIERWVIRSAPDAETPNVWHYQPVYSTHNGEKLHWLCKVHLDSAGRLTGWSEELSCVPQGGARGQLIADLTRMLDDVRRWIPVPYADLRSGMVFARRPEPAARQKSA